MKGSYFPNEYYFFDNDGDKLPEFVEMLKRRGCYIGDDGHVRGPKGGMKSRLLRNGYYMTSAQYNTKIYYFLEHRVVWVWHNGPIEAGLVVNHKDYNRANNHIDNLEVVTQKENVEYSRCNFNPPRGEKSGKAKYSNAQASSIKALGKVCGWTNEQISKLVGCSPVNVSRIRNGKRYPDAIMPEQIMSVFPILVDFTRNRSIGKNNELIDYALGLSGEAGEAVDIIKKIAFHGKRVDKVDLILELGDVLYYVCAIANVLGIGLDEIMLNNNAKLIGRYGNGFSKEASQNRIEDKQIHSGDNR